MYKKNNSFSNITRTLLHINVTLQILRPPLRLRNPAIQHLSIPRPEANFKRLGIHCQSIRQFITTHTIQHGTIFRISRLDDFKRRDEFQKCRVQFAVGEMAADAHATSGSVAIVWCASRGARVVEGVVGEVAVGVEGVGVFEMGVVVVGGEGVHVEIGSCGDGGVVPCDGFDRAPG